MRSIFLVGLMITICCVFFSIIRAISNKKEIARELIKMLCACLASLIMYVVLLITYNERILSVAYCVFFSSVTWSVTYLYRFAILFADKKLEDYKSSVFVIVVACLDSVNMFLNLKFGHAFGVKFFKSAEGEFFPGYTFGWGFYIHLVICYLPILAVFAILIYEAAKAPMLFKRKYITYMILLGVIIAIDGVYLLFGGTVDLSVLCFSFGALASYYYAITFVPQLIISRSIKALTNNMKAAVLLFDINGELVYLNEKAGELFKKEIEEKTEMSMYVRNWLEKSKASKEYEENTWQFEKDVDGDIRIVDMYYRTLRDEKGNFIGAFFNVEDRTEEIARTNAELKEARYDKLTGVYKFEYFSQRATKMLQDNSDKEYVFMVSDIKNFKLVNDIFGQPTGDSVLIKIAEELRRRSDDTVVYGRYDSDSFVLLMEKKDLIVQVFSDVPEQVIKIDDNVSYPIQIYFGVYNIPDHNMPVQIMCDRAMLALKTISGDFSARVAVFDEKMLANMTYQQMLIADMKNAVENEEFIIHLQPQVNAEEEVIGAEALVRWQHPFKGLLYPGAFIEILEYNGFIVQVDMLVWELACRQLRKWKDEGKSQFYISVNISPKDFYVTDVYNVFVNLVEKYNINPRNLKLEITETAMMQDLDSLLVLIDKLKKYGFIVEMDDFGSGYSSLNMLKEINVDVLKLDMAFLGETREQLRARTIMSSIIAMAKDLGMPVIAEGVETEIQVEFLKEIGCDIFQGYYFAKPMEVASFEAKYMS